MINIMSIRAVTEGIELEDDALAELGKIGAKTSLRYVVQLLTPCKILADSQGSLLDMVATLTCFHYW